MNLPHIILELPHGCLHALGKFGDILPEQGDVDLQLLLHLQRQARCRLPAAHIGDQIHPAQGDVLHYAAINCILQGVHVRCGTTCHRMGAAVRGLQTQSISLHDMHEAPRFCRNPRHMVIVVGKAHSKTVEIQFLIQGSESALANPRAAKRHKPVNLPSALLDVHRK